MTPTHVACPRCGGPVHAIAGRCKHCRADLVDARRTGGVEPVPDPVVAPKRRTWVFAVALGSVVATGGSLWAVTRDVDEPAPEPAAQAAPTPAVPAPRTTPAITSFRELLEAAVDAGCRRLQTCGHTGDDPACARARAALANPTLSCTLDRTAAAACVAAIARLSCDALDATTWPDGIRKLTGCTAVCTP
jgi:hypothetical protein